MKIALLAAAAYNLLWGSWVVLFPTSAFSLAHMPVPLYPELWQCIGMIVGVYGVGYAIAAFDPARHWPIVLVGLLGKIFGPIGFLNAAMQGRFPWVAGWTIVTNDLIWWIPFALILRSAWEEYLGTRRWANPEVLAFALRHRLGTGLTIDQLSQKSPVLLVFLRHAGCTFCREALADLAKQRDRLESAGINLVLVHMNEPEFGRQFLSGYGLDDLPAISDPNRTLYRAFGLRRGDMRMLFGPKVWWRGFQAGILGGHGVGRLKGDGFQMPGVFLIFHGQILRSWRHQSAADRPDYVKFATANLPEAVF